MERTLQIAQARFVIEGIIFRYAELLDAGDLEGLAALFARGAIRPAVGEPVRGADEVLSLHTRLVKFYDDDENLVPYQRGQCTPRTRHLTTNLIFEFDNAVMEASVRSLFTVYQTLGGRSEILGGGRYVDRFLRTLQGWHLDEREIIIEHSGDMSRHLHG